MLYLLNTVACDGNRHRDPQSKVGGVQEPHRRWGGSIVGAEGQGEQENKAHRVN